MIDGGGGKLVAMQAPPQAPVGGQTMVGVHVAPVGQGPLFPTVQGTSGGAVGVAMQAPPQAPVGGQTMVGVHVAPVGQGPLFPTVQGTSGGAVGEVMQRPPQVSVWVQVEPAGQGSPERIQEDRDREGFEALGVWATVRDERDERISRPRDCILVESSVSSTSNRHVWIFSVLRGKRLGFHLCFTA